jgi:hypothetical protein
MIVMATVRIVFIRDEVHTTAAVKDRVWRKRYEDMPDATREAVELRIMEPRDKTFVDASQRQPTWPGLGYAMLNELDEPALIEVIEKAMYIGIKNVVHLLLHERI